MKKRVVSMIVCAAILSNIFAVFVAANTSSKDKMLGLSVVDVTDISNKISQNGIMSLINIYSEFTGTFTFKMSAIHSGASYGVSNFWKELISLGAYDSTADADAEIQKIACDTVLKALTDFDEDDHTLSSYAATKYIDKTTKVFKILDKVNFRNVSAGLKKQPINNSNLKDFQYYIDEMLPELKVAYPNLLGDENNVKLLKRIGEKNLLDITDDLCDFSTAMNKLLISIAATDANLEVIKDIRGRIESNTQTYKDLSHILNTITSSWQMNFFNSFLADKLIDEMIGKLLEYVPKIVEGGEGVLEGNIGIAKATLTAVGGINTLLFDIILKIPDIEDSVVLVRLATIVGDIKCSITSITKIVSNGKFSCSQETFQRYLNDSLNIIKICRESLNLSKSIAKHNDEYGTAYVNSCLENLNSLENQITSALNRAGDKTPSKEESNSSTDQAQPKVPGTMTVSASKSNYTTNDNVVLNWTSSLNATEYGLTVKRVEDGKTIFNSRLNGSSKNLGCLEAGTYTYVMRGHNANGKGPLTPVKYFTVTKDANSSTLTNIVVMESEETIIQRIDELYTLVGGKLFNIDGTKDVCIRGNGPHSCVNCRTSSIVNSQWFIDIFGDLDANNFANSFEGEVDKGRIRHACLGFAHFAEWYIFRESNSSQVTTYNVGTYSYTKENLQKYAKVGDILRLDNNHSVIFISCEPNGMNVLHCNWDSGKPMNKIKKSVISYTYGWDKFTISRAINRDNVVSLDEFASISNGDYRFNNNSLCINVLKDKQAIDSINASTSSASIFQISKDGNSHKITSKDSSNSFVLNVWTTGMSTDGSEVTLYKDTGNASQRWYFEKCGNGYLIHPADNVSLSLTRNTSTNKLYVNTTTKNNNQIWVLEDVEGAEDYQGTGNLTITFDPMGGKVSPTSKKGEFNTPYGTLPTPTRNGYVFLGWYTVKGGGGNEVTSTHYVMRNYDHTLYAHWDVSDDQTCTITYNANGGIEPPSPQTVNEGERVTISNEKLSRSGYEFLGWSKKASSNKADYTPGQKITLNEDITLYAVWKAKDESFVLTIGDTKANVFGQIKYNDVAPIIENNRTMLPARFIAENLGADVEWVANTRCVLVTKEDTEIEIFIGDEYAKVNGKKHKLDSPAFIRDNRTYTPVRFICENLGADVEWNSKERSVKITPIKCSVCGSTNHTEHIESDGWEESLPAFVENNQDDYIIEKRTEYLYETRETTTSDKNKKSGWTLYDTKTSEGSWSKWQDQKVTETSTRIVETREVKATYKTQYNYGAYVTKAGTHKPCLHLTDSSQEVWTGWLDYELPIKYSPDDVKGWYCATCASKVDSSRAGGKIINVKDKGGNKYFWYTYYQNNATDNKNEFYWKNERIVEDTPSHTEYRYKNIENVYYFERWIESEWTSKKKSENSNCRLVDTRIVYKYESR